MKEQMYDIRVIFNGDYDDVFYSQKGEGYLTLDEVGTACLNAVLIGEALGMGIRNLKVVAVAA